MKLGSRSGMGYAEVAWVGIDDDKHFWFQSEKQALLTPYITLEVSTQKVSA